MERFKRAVSLVLCMVMVLGFLPVSVFAETGDTHYLMFATDRHANTSIIGEIINNMETVIGENALEYLALGGDMVGSGSNHPAYNSSTVLSEATGAADSLSADNVDIVAGIHDMNVTDDAGIVLKYQNGGAQIYAGDGYYVYGVEEYCISEDSNESNWSAQAQAFVDWANGDGIDKSAVIFVSSHYPLHAKRSDNDGAYYWHQALNTVATGGDDTVERDIVFFHGHNHTVDKNEYVYNVGDTMSIQNGNSTVSEPIYYTYATAGYLNQNSKATLVTLTDDEIVLEKYTTSGSSTMTTVTRAVTATEEAYITSIAVTTMPDKTVYDVGEELDTTGMVVTAAYSDGTTAEVSNWYTLNNLDMTTEGEKEVTVRYVNNGTTFKTTFKITVEEQAAADAVLVSIEITSNPVKNEYLVSDALDITGMVVEATFSDGTVKTLEYAPFNNGDGYTVGEFCMYHEMDYEAVVSYTYGDVTCTDTFLVNVWEENFGESDVTVHVTEIGVIDITAAESDNAHVETALADVMTGYTAYDIDLTFHEGYATTNADATVTLPIPAGVTNPVVYYVSDDGATVTNMDAKTGDGVVTFTTDHFSTYAVGENTQQGQESDVTVPGYSNTVETEVWKLADTITAGNTYLIVNTNAAGDGYALLNNNGSVSAVAVTVVNDGTNTYIELDNANAEWTLSANASNASYWDVKNGSYYLGHDSSWGTYYLTLDGTSESWSSNGTNLYFTFNLMGTRYRYLTYSDGWTLSSSSSNVYFYTPDTIITGSSKPDTTYHMDLTVDGTTVSDHAHTVTGVVSGKRVQMNALYTATANGTSTAVDAPSGGSYTVLSSSNEAVATIGTDGVLTFTGVEGETLVQVEYTWTENGVEYKTRNYVVITAKAPVYDMTITEPESTQVKIGATATLAAAVTADGTAATGTVTWSSSDESIATVDQSGVVTGVAAGDVTITATYTDPNGNVHTDSIKLEVLDAVYTIEISEKVENEDGTYTTTPITKPIVIKDVDTLIANGTNTHSVWAVITRDGVDMGALSEEDLEKLTFISSDESIAEVDKATGVVTFVGGEGTVQITAIYTYAEGKSVTDTVTFSVSRGTYMIPSDGTDDFPKYPEEGAIRFDKTAVAQGSFSETGIAKVELSMTGVPYTTGNEIDVVLMLDMTGSMDDVTSSTSEPTGYVRIDATIAASKAFIDTIVKNVDGTYNGNRIGVYVFNKNGAATLFDFGTVDSDSELEAIYADLNTIKDDHFASGGTPYDDGLAKCYDVLAAAKTDELGKDRQQFTVFMTDGVPTDYEYITGTTHANYSSASDIAGMLTSSDNYATRDTDYKYEYYSTEMKKAGVTVYSVGVGLENENNAWSGSATQCLNLASVLLNDISGPGGETSQPDAVGTKTLSKKDSYFFSVEDATAATDMKTIFSNIATKILEAATDVVVEDKIEEHYTMNFKLPNTGVTAEEAGMSEFYIQVVDYTLDSTTHQRTGNYSVLENITFNADGTVKSHTVDGAACGTTCSHVTFNGDTVSAIDGTYFDYTIDENGDEFLHWNAEKLTSTELALQYFVYLDESAGYPAADQVDPGTYNTNEYATITYTNHLGNKCQQYFPIPSQTWMGAQVTYVFYLVNDQGQPVNRAGVVVPFAEAVYVTQPYTYDVTWNEDKGVEKLSAEYLAKDKVPSVYKLYDEEAYYEILVYQNEGVDNETQEVNYNHFIIEGAADKLIDSAMDADTTVNNSTTKVYNTKAGTKFDEYGAYSATEGSYTSSNSGKSYKATVTNDIDYANTTVAFAVMWLPELANDTVVVDYGLDVIIDVTANDGVAASVVGVRANAPAGVSINDGTYTAAKAVTAEVYIDANHDANALKELKLGTATVESLSSVRFSLDKTTGMQFADPAVFYYEADVNHYDANNVLQTSSMYASVTVIPATSIYYEDSFVELKSYTWNYDAETEAEQDWINSTDFTGESATLKWEGHQWTTEGQTYTGSAAVQDTDRPGDESLLGNDANNLYGYDSHYDNCSQYSLGSAARINVDYDNYGEVGFTFAGTGFDVISMTSNETGTILVTVYDQNGKVATCADGTTCKLVVDTYYGYARKYVKNVYTYTNGEWTVETTDVEALGESQTAPENPTEGATYNTYSTKWYTVDSNNPNALYQVPVMKVEGLTYGTYSVVIEAMYDTAFDHDQYDDGSYDFYLDAIRIYDPANDGAVDSTIENAYQADGEYLPEYYELRNWLISRDTFYALDANTTIEGVAFVGVTTDGTASGSGTTASVEEYNNYGPNNELYLAPGQAVAFMLNGSADAPEGYEVKSVQIAMKSVGGTAAVKLWGAGSDTVSSAGEMLLETATDLYYDITNLDNKTVVIMNSGTEASANEETGAADDDAHAILSITNVKVTYKAADENGGADAQSVQNELKTASFGTIGAAQTYAVAAAAETETETVTDAAPFTVNVAAVEMALASIHVDEEREPETTEPEATEPETTEPETTEPETTEPEATEPETTEPEATEPEGDSGSESAIGRLIGWIIGLIGKIFG